jgi:hypothetical protein
MATEIRHCDTCDHEFEVEVTSGGSRAGPVEGCPDQSDDCGLANAGDQAVRIIRQID